MAVNRFRSLGVLETLKEFHLPPVPYGQIFISRGFLGPTYRFPKRTVITIDGLERMNNEKSFMVAMNHTDRFNYAPFMYHLDQVGLPPLAPWVKGKYYQNPHLARLLVWCACTPVPARGFLLTLDWLARMERRPNEFEYRQLRRLGDRLEIDAPLEDGVADYLTKAPGGDAKSFGELFADHFETLSGEFIRINVEALELGYRPLVFPQGTRSKRMTQGFSGIIQMALHLGVPILPVAVTGSEDIYPDDSPLAKGGHVHYTIGDFYDPMAGGDIPQNFIPMTIRASQEHGQRFDVLTAELMDCLNALLPSDYQFDPSEKKDLADNPSGRFV